MSEREKRGPIGPCPDPETLSALFDGEVVDAAAREHARLCPTCAETLKAYARLDEDLRRSLEAAVPPNLTASILNAVRLENEKTYVIPFPRLALRLAASAALLAGGAYLYLNWETLPLPCPAPAKAPVTMTVAAEPKPSPIATLSDDAPARFSVKTERDDLSDGVSFNRVIPVGAGANWEAVPGPRRQNSAATIGRSVRQIWVVKDLNKASSEFSGFLRDIGIDARSISVNPQPGLTGSRVIIGAPMNVKQLVDLVRKCDTAGFALVNDAQPQPEQKLFSNDADTPVTYLADLVSE